MGREAEMSQWQPRFGVGQARFEVEVEVEVEDRRSSDNDAGAAESGEAERLMGRRWRFQARASSDRAEATSGSGGESRALRPLLHGT